MTSSYTILLLFQVQIHSTIVFISQDLVYFNHITSNTSIFKSWQEQNKKLCYRRQAAPCFVLVCSQASAVQYLERSLVTISYIGFRFTNASN